MATPLVSTEFEVTSLYVIGHESVWSTESVDTLEIDWHGIPGDRHYGATRIMRPYESADLARREIANDKQLSVVDEQDMRDIADDLDLPVGIIEERSAIPIARFMAEQLAANIVVGGIARKLNRAVESGTLLAFGDDKEEIGAVLRVTEYNQPCKKPSIKLKQTLGTIGLNMGCEFDEFKQLFKKAASDKRGWVASVHSAGEINVGDRAFVHAPISPPMS